MITGSKELIRDINSHLVLESIVNNGPISRADLAKALGLTKATISAIVQVLIDEHLVIEIGSAQTYKGRKPILLDLNQSGGYVISLDVSVDYITVLTSDLKGTHCFVKQYKNTGCSQEILPVLIPIIEKTIEGLAPAVHGVIGISIGIHGVVHHNHVMFTPYYSIKEDNLSDALSEHFHVPVFMDNEANLSVLGERTFYFDYPNIINLSVHSGIGMGILIDDQLYTGYNGYAGEFGHTIIVPDGRPCPCGNHGCFEQYASERAILMDYAKRKGMEEVSIDTLIRAYQAQDSDAREVILQFVKYMAIGINNILNTFNPNLIIINSSFTMYIPDITTQIQDSLCNRMDKYCTILPSGLQDTAILLGGACVVIKNFLGIDKLVLKP